MSPGDARLRQVLGGDGLAALRRRLRRRFEQAPLDAGIDGFRIGKLAPEEHAALASLLGRPQRYASSLHVDVRLVDLAFQRSGIAVSLRDALEQLDGPIVHAATARLRLESLWAAAIRDCAHRGLADLLSTPAGLGLLKRLARQDSTEAARLCQRAEAVLRRLPAKGMTRSQLAAEALGDSHALDSGRPAATLVLAACRRADPLAESETDDAPASTEEPDAWRSVATERDRETWARSGVLVNELARPALFLNLPTTGSANHGRPPGEPVYASLRSLLRAPSSWDVADRPVFVCENPNLVAIAADQWGARCAPLVCTDGMPAAAQRCLLVQLASARAQLRYHGDFDWPGVRIANHVMRVHGAQPWRFGAADYEAAVRAIASERQMLTGTPVEAVWDGALAAAMQEYLVSIAEEAVAAELLPDLADR